MITVGVRGCAVWTAESGAPAAALLPANLRRRCSLLSRIVAQLVGDLVASNGDPLAAAWVCGTTLGEIATTVELLRMMHEGDRALSPIRFAGSVHNAALGQLAIALGHRGNSTTISAGTSTAAMVLIEAAASVHARRGSVIAIVADEPTPTPLQPAHDGLGAAFELVPLDVEARARLRLLGPTPDAPRLGTLPASIAHHPLAPAWALANAITLGTTGRFALEPTHGARATAFCVEVEAR